MLERQEVEKLGDLIQAYWYNRDEDDIDIVYEITQETVESYLKECLTIARIFSDTLISDKANEALLRKWVWHPLPHGAEGVKKWLDEVLVLFQKAAEFDGSKNKLRKYVDCSEFDSLYTGK